MHFLRRPSSWSRERTLVLVVLVLLFSASLLWAWHTVGMQENGMMESCLLAGGRVVLCALSSAQQVGLWNEMFTAMLPLGVFFVLAAAISHGRSEEPVAHGAPLPISRVSARVLAWVSSEPLKRALSQGILHPKTFNPAQS